MSIKDKALKISKKQRSERITQNPDIKLVKEIASISERAERSRASLIPQQIKLYKL